MAKVNIRTLNGIRSAQQPRGRDVAEAFDDIVAALNKLTPVNQQSGPAVPTPNTIGTQQAPTKTVPTSGIGQPSPSNSQQGVTTFTGDGTVLSNSASTGGVVATLELVAPNAFLGGPEFGSSDELPTYRYIETPDLPLGGTWDFMGILSGNFDITGNFSVLGELLDSTGSSGANGQVLSSTGTGVLWTNGGGGGGGVSSVGLSMPSIFSVANSPVTSSGTLAVSLVSESANLVWAGPTSGSAAPTFRSLVVGDLPTTGTWPFAGTISGNLIFSGNPKFTGELLDSTGSAGTNGQILSSTGSGILWETASGSGAAFSSISTGTNTSATMTVGSGASIVTSGSGIVEATQVQAVVVSSSAPSAGQVLTATSSTAADWASPSVTSPQGTPMVPGLIGTGTNSNWANYTLWCQIKGSQILFFPTSFQIRIMAIGGTGISISSSYLFATAQYSTSVLYSSGYAPVKITWNGGNLPYSVAFSGASATAPYTLVSDAVSGMTFDENHDYYVYIYLNSDSNSYNSNLVLWGSPISGSPIFLPNGHIAGNSVPSLSSGGTVGSVSYTGVPIVTDLQVG